jgi:hypothetical protein
MENSQENTTIDEVLPVNVDRFFIQKYSRWMGPDGRLLVVLGFYYGNADKPETGLNHREALDLLSVHDEKVEYVLIRRFVNLVNLGKIVPWEDQEFKAVA